MISGDRHITVVQDNADRLHVCQSPLTWKALRVYLAIGTVGALLLPIYALEIARQPWVMAIPAASVAGAGFLIARRTGEVVVDREHGMILVRIREWAFLEKTTSTHRTRLEHIEIVSGPGDDAGFTLVQTDGKRIPVMGSRPSPTIHAMATKVSRILEIPLVEAAPR